MAKYQESSRITQNEAIKIFTAGTNTEICDALLAIIFHDEDWRWSQEQCLYFLSHSDPDISGLAATCLGHIARIHHKLDRELVTTALRKRLNDPKISGRVKDALEDIETFVC